MTDYRIEAKVRNARILRALEAIGETPSGFSKARGLNVSRMCAIAAMKCRPTNANGEWWPEVMALCDATKKTPCDLFTERQMQANIGKDIKKDVTEEYVLIGLADADVLLMDDHSSDDRTPQIQIANRLFSELANTYPRYARAVAMQQSDATLEEIGNDLGVTKERARQIIFRGERHMRKRARELFGARSFQECKG